MVLDLTKIQELKDLDDDGSDSVLRELVEMYLASTPTKLKKMYEFYCLRNLVELKKEAHSVRSSTLALGGSVMAATAAEIEYFKDGAANADEQMHTLVMRILKEFKELEQVLKAYL